MNKPRARLPFWFIAYAVVFWLLLTLAWCSRAEASEWSDADVARESIYAALWIADWGQTRNIARHPDQWYERNDIIGRHPTKGRVDGYFASGLLLHIAATELMPASWRPAWQIVSIVYEADVVRKNHQLGIRITF